MFWLNLAPGSTFLAIHNPQTSQNSATGREFKGLRGHCAPSRPSLRSQLLKVPLRSRAVMSPRSRSVQHQ